MTKRNVHFFSSDVSVCMVLFLDIIKEKNDVEDHTPFGQSNHNW